VLAWIALAAAVGSPYDSSIPLEAAGATGERDAPPLDALVMRTLGPLAHWDGVYFTHLALTGGDYSYEQFYAFFPLLPWCLRVIRYVFCLPCFLL
jgi:hypothetical protein